MSLTLVAPALVVVAVGLALAFLQPPLRPAAEVRLLSAYAVVAGLAGLSILLAIATGFVSRTRLGAVIVSACPALPVGHGIGVVDGVSGTALLVYGVIRFGRTLGRSWRLRRVAGSRRFAVIDSPQPSAFAVPSRPGCVVVSRGLLDRVTPQQRRVVFAHERAHLQSHHHRHLLAGHLMTSFVPPLRPLARRIRLVTEIAADQSALRAVGNDRGLVAGTIASMAKFAGSPAQVVPAFGGGAVDARLAALWAPPMGPRRRLAGRIAALTAVGVLAGTAAMQAHHLAAAVWHICGG